MLNISIISVGKIKEKYWQSAVGEYLKRLTPYCRINFLEVPEEKIGKNFDRRRVLEKEAARLKKLIPDKATIISLDRTGREFTSLDWSEKLEEWAKFTGRIVFIIGGPLGLAPEITSQSNVLLSLSKMTFTHQMARVILLEQIYRGVMIAGGKQYHY